MTTDPTSDNLLLSEPSVPPLNWAGNGRFADNCTQSTLTANGHAVNCTVRPDPFAVNCTDERLLELIEAATAPNTRRAYQSDLKHFTAWGGEIPTNADTVARYLAAHSEALRPATLARRLAALSKAHELRGLPDPTKAGVVEAVMKGIGRTYGRSQRGANPLVATDLKTVVRELGQSLLDTRDRAVLLLGFAGAFRRSELVTLEWSDVVQNPRGIVVRIRRSKTRPTSERTTNIPFGHSEFCPVKALDQWKHAAAVNEGPIFRAVTRHGRVGGQRLSGEAVSVLVRRRLAQAGINTSGYSSHSLRAGFVTTAALSGVPSWRIREQTGHASDLMLQRYIRPIDAFERHPAADLL